jgi:hypothetical protein
MSDPAGSDFARFKALFDDVGLGYTEDDPEAVSPRSLVLKAHANDNVEGYAGFVAVFSFTETGKFIAAGIWE